MQAPGQLVIAAHLPAAPWETRDSAAAFASSAAEGVEAVGWTSGSLPPAPPLAAPWRPAPGGCLPDAPPLAAAAEGEPAALLDDGSSWEGLCAFCRSALLGAWEPPPCERKQARFGSMQTLGSLHLAVIDTEMAVIVCFEGP
jgi:hypothetical protein